MLHRSTGESAHLGQLSGQTCQLPVIRGPHIGSVRPTEKTTTCPKSFTRFDVDFGCRFVLWPTPSVVAAADRLFVSVTAAAVT
jgi:hypothetical protein